MKRLALLAAITLLGCGGGTTATEPTTSADTQTSGTESSSTDTSSTDTSSTDTSSTETSSTETSSTETSSTGADASGPSADLADYARRTMVIVRRHWTIPATLSPEAAVALSSTISISIDETTHRATGYRIVSESGNAIFDESVRRGLQALVDANELMPEPPVGLDDRASVRLRLTGRR